MWRVGFRYTSATHKQALLNAINNYDFELAVEQDDQEQTIYVYGVTCVDEENLACAIHDLKEAGVELLGGASKWNLTNH